MRLRVLLQADRKLEPDLRDLGLAYVREMEKTTRGRSMFERAEAAALVLVCLRASEKLYGLAEAEAMLDRIGRSLTGCGLRGRRPVLPVSARRRLAWPDLAQGERR